MWDTLGDDSHSETAKPTQVELKSADAPAWDGAGDGRDAGDEPRAVTAQVKIESKV